MPDKTRITWGTHGVSELVHNYLSTAGVNIMVVVQVAMATIGGNG